MDRRRRVILAWLVAGDGRGGSGDVFVLPQRGDLFGWSAAEAASSTWVRTNRTTSLGMGLGAQTTTTINNYSDWAFLLDSGTHRLDFVTITANNCGIATVTVNGAAAGTFDLYSASTTDNVVFSITGLSFPAGRLTVKVTMAAKHASSSAYQQNILSITPTRTGV